MAAHSHSHQHGSEHSHDYFAGVNTRKLLAVVLIAWSLFIIQLVGAWVTGSLALLFDTVHVATDAIGVTVALIVAHLAARPPSARRTWGLKRLEVLAAMVQATMLLGVGAFVMVEAVQRFFDPQPLATRELLVFGTLGLAVNVVMILILLGGDRRNFNMRAAFLEVVNDALGSVAVIAGAIIIALTGWLQADALAAILIGLLIVPRTLKLLKETVSVLLESAPRGLDVEDVRRHLETLPHVVAVHDLHASQISSDLPILTAHVVVKDDCLTDGCAVETLKRLQTCVAEHFEVSIRHSTFQIEPESLQAAGHYDQLP